MASRLSWAAPLYTCDLDAAKVTAELSGYAGRNPIATLGLFASESGILAGRRWIRLVKKTLHRTRTTQTVASANMIYLPIRPLPSTRTARTHRTKVTALHPL
jgi:hypothetical protein